MEPDSRDPSYEDLLAMLAELQERVERLEAENAELGTALSSVDSRGWVVQAASATGWWSVSISIGGHSAESALLATAVVGAFDPGDDREAQLVAGGPALLVQDVAL